MMRAAWLVGAKELRETLRDPHVAVFVLFPVVFYPLAIWGATQVSVLALGWDERRPYTIDVEGPPALVEALLEPPARPGAGGVDALVAGEVDVVVRAREEEGGRWAVDVHQGEGSLRSLGIGREVRERLTELREARYVELALDRGLRAEDVATQPVVVEDLSTARGLATSMLAVIVALVTPLSLALAGVYPAVDVFVGERERGTLETTLLLPVSRAAVLAGKLGACVALMVGAGLGNLVALILSVVQLGVSLFGSDAALPLAHPVQLLAVMPAMVATSAWIAAVYCWSMVPARTFKEGELTGSIVLILALPVLAALMPPLLAGEGEGALGWFPTAGLAVALHDAIRGELTAWTAVRPVLVDGGTAAVLVGLAARFGGRESFLVEGRLPRWLGFLHRGAPS